MTKPDAVLRARLDAGTCITLVTSAGGNGYALFDDCPTEIFTSQQRPGLLAAFEKRSCCYRCASGVDAGLVWRRCSSPHRSDATGDLLGPRDGQGASTLGADESSGPVLWIGGDFGKVSSGSRFHGWSHRPV
jgi:hypothetical protein